MHCYQDEHEKEGEKKRENKKNKIGYENPTKAVLDA